MTSIAAPSIVASEIKRNRALALRLEGKNYREIAEALTDEGSPCSKTRAYEYVREALDEIKAECTEKAAEVHAIELARLDAQVDALWAKRADPRTADTILRIAERRARLMGLDAPEQLRIGGGGPPVGHAHAGWDLSKLTTEQLLDLERIAATAGAAPIAPLADVPDSGATNAG